MTGQVLQDSIGHVQRTCWMDTPSLKKGVLSSAGISAATSVVWRTSFSLNHSSQLSQSLVPIEDANLGAPATEPREEAVWRKGRRVGAAGKIQSSARKDHVLPTDAELVAVTRNASEVRIDHTRDRSLATLKRLDYIQFHSQEALIPVHDIDRAHARQHHQLCVPEAGWNRRASTLAGRCPIGRGQYRQCDHTAGKSAKGHRRIRHRSRVRHTRGRNVPISEKRPVFPPSSEGTCTAGNLVNRIVYYQTQNVRDSLWNQQLTWAKANGQNALHRTLRGGESRSVRRFAPTRLLSAPSALLERLTFRGALRR